MIDGFLLGHNNASMAKKKKRSRGRPATGQTPHRGFRIPDDEYAKIVDAAELCDETATDFVRRVALEAAVKVLEKGRQVK
jgi:hypothetical protein